MPQKLALALLLLTASLARPQSPDTTDTTPLVFSRVSIGIVPAWDFSLHRASFITLDQVCNCGVYEKGFGNGPAGGLSLEFGLSKRIIVGLRASLVNASGTMTARLDVDPVRDTATGKTDTIPRDHVFNETLLYGSGSLFVKLYPFALGRPGFNPFISVAGSLGVSLVKTYEQREVITTPNPIKIFPDGTTDHRVGGGTLPNIGPRFSASVGVGQDIFLSTTWSLVPEVDLDYGFTPTSDSLKWFTNIIAGSLTLRYTFPPAPIAAPPPAAPTPLPAPPPIAVEKEQVVEPATPPANRPKLKVTVRAQTKDGAPPGPILVEEVHVAEEYPFLSFVFFDSASATIPPRYTLLDPPHTEVFTELGLKHSTMGAYYDLLNIVGKRMKNYPDTRLTITGCIDDETEPRELARKRAEAVRDYFLNVWGIEPKRLKVVARGHPETKSNPEYDEGRAENRRVELSSDDREDVFAPVMVVDTAREATLDSSRSSGVSPQINFVPIVLADAGVKTWKLDIGSGSTILRSMQGADSVPPDIEWNLKGTDNQPPTTNGALLYSFTITDKMGQTQTTSPRSLPIEQRTLNKMRSENEKERTIEKFSLIVFQYNSKSISRANKLLAERIARHITPGAEVTVLGYTDKLGGDDYDRELAQGRAETVANIIQNSAPTDEYTMTVSGVGKTNMYPNDTQEGRFFNRTVQVIISSKK